MASLLTQADVARLLAEPSATVRAEVADKLAREIDSPVLNEAELQIAHDILRVMAKDVELTVRSALSASLRAARRLPHDVAMRLANDVEAVVRKLKAELDGDIDIEGTLLARSLGDLGLIDQYGLYLHPVVLGSGKPFFAGPRPPLRLVASERMEGDVIKLTYVPADRSPTP